MLPTYVVSAPRMLPAERQIAIQRDEFVRQALAPRAIVADLAKTPLADGNTLRLTEARQPKAPAKARS